MITIIESYFLKLEYTLQAVAVLQELDDLLGPNAHANTGHAGHARFVQDISHPAQVRVIYRWRDRESFMELMRTEEPLVSGFVSKYCSRPRLVQLHDELSVEVDHHDDESPDV